MPIKAYTQANLQTAQDKTIETIPLQASVQVSPPQINIQTFAAGTFTINRKAPSSKTWSAVTTGVTLSATGTWTDTNVSVGTLYEYQFINTAGTAPTGVYPSGYILTGINVDQTQPKGHFAVVVASDLPVSLPTEYAQYKADLIDDGWIVNEIQVPRAANYRGLGNGALASVKVTTGGLTSVASGATVILKNPSGKMAVGTLTVNSTGTITGVGGLNTGGAGAGFAVNDQLTIQTGGAVTTGTIASLTAHVTATQTTLSYASPQSGGTGYTSGQTVTVTGQTSGATAQCTLFASSPGGSLYELLATTSQSGFIVGEALTMTGNTTGSGVGVLTVAALTNGTQLYYSLPHSPGTGYTNGEAGILTGNQSGKTANVTLNVGSGYITNVTVVSSDAGFISGESLTLSGTSTGTGAPLFTASVASTGPLQSVTVNSGGSGYRNGEVVNIIYGTGVAQGTLSVSGGAITGVTITSPGTGFVNGGGLSLSGITSGYNISVATIDNSGIGSAVTVSAGGSGYSNNDQVAIKGNASGATAIGSIIAPAGAITGVSVVLPNTFTPGETLTLTPSFGGSGASATAGASTELHLLIRSSVQALYNAYPGQLKNVVMIGKVPVCRSGIYDGAGADGHGNECPYGADAFYAEMLGVVGVDWTDTKDDISTFFTEYNLPGDMQFDQQRISQVGNGGVELGFGRIDLSLNILTEVEAERAYFNKLHLYKIADPSFLPGRNICDRYSYPNERETDLQSMPGVVGINNITFIGTTDLPTVESGQDPDQLYSAQHGPYLFYFKGGDVPLDGEGGKAVFWTGMQSHWGYWYQNNNNMQLRLGENSFTLDFTWNIWGLRYIYHRMGMGLDAGDMMMQSINNNNQSNVGPYTYKYDNVSDGDFSGALYMNQMGDPALRLFMFAPPSNLSVVATSGSPVLSWTASPEGTVTGYHVYRAANANAPFTRLTSTPVTGTTYTDSSVNSGSYVYMVRAVRLETTGGGTFYNASLGITQSINIGAAATPVTIATTSLPGFFWNTSSSTSLTAQGGIPQYIWSVTAGALPGGLTLSTTGVISGTPTGIGTFNFTAQAADQIGQKASQAYTLVVSSNSQISLYPTATTYTSSSAPTTSYGTSETNEVNGLPTTTYEIFHRYDLSGVNLNNGFVKATLYFYVTSNTASGTNALLQANLIADAADGWVDNGIAKFFSSAAASPTSGWTRIHCVSHGFTTGTQVTLAGLTGLSTTTAYAITSIDADDFDIHVTYGNWAYDPALAYATTLSMVYNTRPTTYDLNVPTLTATGTDTPGSILQMDVTSYVREVLNNFPSKQMGIRFFTGTPQTLAIGSLNAYGAAIPYLVIETTNAPKIVINSPSVNPAVLMAGSSLAINTTVTPLPSRAASLALQWSKISGPGTVTFTNPITASTGVSFSTAGDYVIRLTANDGVAQSYQDMTVHVLTVPLAGPTDSMLLHLAFDETSGTIAGDSSGVTPANNGTLTANPVTNPLPTWSSTAKIGGALSFPGTGQRVDVPDSSTLDGMQQLTVSLWFYANALPVGTNTYAGLVSKRTGSKESYTLRLRGTTAGTTSLLYFDVNGLQLTSPSLATILPNQWYHVAMVFDGTQTANNLRLYLNGNTDKFGPIVATAVPRNPTANLRIGALDTTDTLGFNGLIDDVRIYNRVLSLSEIQDLNSVVPSDIGPVISTAATLTGTVNVPLSLTASAMDDGKPTPVLTYNWVQLNGPDTLTIASPTSISTSTTPGAPGTYALQFSASDSVVTTYANVSATITGQTYSSWASQQGLTGTNALPASIGSADGFTNLFKYALGLNPSTIYNPGSAGLPLVQIQNVSGTGYLSLTFTGVATDLTYTVQATNDLTGTWTNIQTFAIGTAPGTVTVRDTQATSVSPKRFMRLVISQ